LTNCHQNVKGTTVPHSLVKNYPWKGQGPKTSSAGTQIFDCPSLPANRIGRELVPRGWTPESESWRRSSRLGLSAQIWPLRLGQLNGGKNEQRCCLLVMLSGCTEFSLFAALCSRGRGNRRPICPILSKLLCRRRAFRVAFCNYGNSDEQEEKGKTIAPAAMILVVPRCVIWGLLSSCSRRGFFLGGAFSFVHLVALLCQVLSWILLVHALDLRKLARRIEEQILALVRNPLNRNCEGNSYW
jgi:hypothetical protein